MSAYRSAPIAAGKKEEDVRRLTIAPIGTFGIAVWGGFIIVMGSVMALATHVGSNDGLGARPGATIAAVTAAVLLLFVSGMLLFETQLTLVARIEGGTLELEEWRRIGTKRVRSFAFRDLTGVSVEDHGEDHVAAVLHTRKKQIPIFATRIGDDARRVAQFAADAIASWRHFTAVTPDEEPSRESGA